MFQENDEPSLSRVLLFRVLKSPGSFCPHTAGTLTCSCKGTLRDTGGSCCNLPVFPSLSCQGLIPTPNMNPHPKFSPSCVVLLYFGIFHRWGSVRGMGISQQKSNVTTPPFKTMDRWEIGLQGNLKQFQFPIAILVLSLYVPTFRVRSGEVALNCPEFGA